MREVTDVRERRQIKIGECFTETIRPCIGKERVMLCPAHARRHRDARQRRRLTLHHGNAARMRGAVVRKAAGQISGLEKIFRERGEHVVERVPAIAQ